MIVADTSLASYLLIEGERTAAARAVWRRDPEWILPALWRAEYLNVLTLSVRAKVLTGEQAIAAWHAGSALFARSERDPGGEPVLRTALRHGVSAYDAQFLCLAERLEVPLVTADRKLVRACPALAVLLEDFARLS